MCKNLSPVEVSKTKITLGGGGKKISSSHYNNQEGKGSEKKKKKETVCQTAEKLDRGKRKKENIGSAWLGLAFSGENITSK